MLLMVELAVPNSILHRRDALVCFAHERYFNPCYFLLNLRVHDAEVRVTNFFLSVETLRFSSMPKLENFLSHEAKIFNGNA